ncbi:MAG TPA: ankyrin repeat domain-containing protein [Pirellulaceae bacterium]|nr:ankyrin repeat domain-containing protein [Pirellulaceae bacterium]
MFTTRAVPGLALFPLILFTLQTVKAQVPDLDKELRDRQIQRLFTAAQLGDCRELDRLLRLHPELVNASYPYHFSGIHGWTVLHCAVVADDCQLARLLLSRGADPNSECATRDRPLHMLQSAKMGRLLLAAGADANGRGAWEERPIHHARTLEIARLLVAHGARVNDQDNDWRGSPLHHACRWKRLRVAQYLLSHGADIAAKNDWQRTPLHEAAASGDSRIVKLLLHEGAEVNARDEEEYTALHSACAALSPLAVDLLLAAGADARAASKSGITPLLWAAAAGEGEADAAAQLAIIEQLVKHGANLHATNADGQSALHFAASEGRLEVVEYLLKQRLSANAKDRLDRTPLHDAMELHRTITFGLRGDGSREVAITRTLIEHGADIKAVAYLEDTEHVGEGDEVRTIVIRRPVTLRQLAQHKGLDWSPDDEGFNQFPLQGGDVNRMVTQWRTRNAVKQEFLEMLDQANPGEE